MLPSATAFSTIWNAGHNDCAEAVAEKKNSNGRRRKFGEPGPADNRMASLRFALCSQTFESRVVSLPLVDCGVVSKSKQQR